MKEIDKVKVAFASEHPDCIKSVDLEFTPKAGSYLLDTEIWPKAVHSNLIINDEDHQKKKVRAKTVVKSYTKSVKNKSFLDFGSGDNLTKLAAAEAGARLALAYDVKESNDVSTAWDEVTEAGPFDIILMYDVFDHLTDHEGNLLNVNQIPEVLKMIRGVLSQSGSLFMRCHPWTARHGTHCYLKKNRAFAQYVTAEYDGLPTIKITSPVSTYESVIGQAGLRVKSKKVNDQTVEQFFLGPAARSFKNHFGENNVWMYQKVMSFTFVDFELGR
jgi:hypothetical protein